MRPDLQKHYRALGLSPGATAPEIKQAYRQLIQRWHPDHFKAGSIMQTTAEDTTKELNEAYEQLYKKQLYKKFPPKAPGKPTDPDAATGPAPRARKAYRYEPPPPPAPVHREKPAPAPPPAEKASRPAPPKPKPRAKAKPAPKGGPASKSRRYPWIIPAAALAVVASGLVFWWTNSRAAAPSPDFGQIAAHATVASVKTVATPPLCAAGNPPQAAPHSLAESPARPRLASAADSNPAGGASVSTISLSPNSPAKVVATERIAGSVPNPARSHPQATAATLHDPSPAIHRTDASAPGARAASARFATTTGGGASVSSLTWNLERSPASLALAPEPSRVLDEAERVLDTFERGDSKLKVLALQGAPEEARDNIFRYGSSLVYFADGRVTGWSDGVPRLRVRPRLDVVFGQLDHFTAGSSRLEVFRAQGEPTALLPGAYVYGASAVFFEDDRVTRWMEADQPLRAQLLSPLAFDNLAGVVDRK